MRKLKLIVLDCDGVISEGEAQPIDLSLLTRLADLNRRAKNGEAVPAVTLNTGRPSPYVEAVMQAIGGWQPALYESGAGMYFPHPYRFETTPLLNAERRSALAEVISRLDKAMVQTGKAYWQPGKTVCHSLFAGAPLTIEDIIVEVRDIATAVSLQIKVAQAKLALNIYPAGIDKGTGLHWLAQVTGIDPMEMGGVGDTSGDIDFLRLVGFPAAPDNATEDVKSVVRYIAPQAASAGVHNILDRWLSSFSN